MRHDNDDDKKGFTQPATSIVPLQTQATRIIYVTQLNVFQVSDEEKETLAWISARLGEKSWQDALIIFTDAHRVKPARKFASILKKRTDMLHTAIAIHAGWDIASRIASRTLSAPEEPLVACQQWLQECLTIHEACTYLLILVGTREIVTLLVEPGNTAERSPCPQKVLSMLPVPRHCARAFVCFYFSLVPVSAMGLFVDGIAGYVVAMLINMIIWATISFLDIL
ncbi:MAG TPA: hypothetical protein VFB12_28135 [Ktedonobacteraceae bacterium]|nr:hypothetical protein [Ktedonobacteraceae bacterium]